MANVVLVGAFEAPVAGGPAGKGIPVVVPMIHPVWGWSVSTHAAARKFALTADMLAGRRLGFYALPGVDEGDSEERVKEVIAADPGAQAFVAACHGRIWIELLG